MPAPGGVFRRLIFAALILVVLYAGVAGALLYAMSQPPPVFGAFMAKFPMPLMAVLPFRPLWNIARDGELDPGEIAPDFTLSTPDKSQSVRLATFRGKSPVVLVFGSYT